MNSGHDSLVILVVRCSQSALPSGENRCRDTSPAADLSHRNAALSGQSLDVSRGQQIAHALPYKQYCAPVNRTLANGLSSLGVQFCA